MHSYVKISAKVYTSYKRFFYVSYKFVTLSFSVFTFRRPDEFYKESESILQDPEIIYTVTDAIDVEQGAGGFVNRIKGTATIRVIFYYSLIFAKFAISEISQDFKCK